MTVVERKPIGTTPLEEYWWSFSLPKDQRLMPDKVSEAGEALYQDFMGPRKSREAFMMSADPHDLAYRLLYLVGSKNQRRFAASISAAAEVLEGIKRKDGTPHLSHVLRVALRTTYRLRDLHGKLTSEDIDRIEVMLQHDTQEDGLREKKLKEHEVHEIVFSNWNREKNSKIHWIKNINMRRRNNRVYRDATLFDQYENDDSDNKKPNYEQNLKDAGWSSEKLSGDTLDSLLGDMAKTSTLLINSTKEILEEHEVRPTFKELKDMYIQLKGTDNYYAMMNGADIRKPDEKPRNGSIKKTEKRREFFGITSPDKLTAYDHNQVDIYLNAAERFVKALEAILKTKVPAQRTENPVPQTV